MEVGGDALWFRLGAVRGERALRLAVVGVVIAVLALLGGATRAVAEPPIAFGDYYALVIGNNDYADLPRLETAVSDAAAVAELLRSRYAFKDVTLLLNARRTDILDSLNRLRADLTEKDNLLIYYAGHGYVDVAGGEGFWQPVDALADNDTDWISNSTLTRYLRTMSAKHVMVVADSCYSGTLLRDGGSGPPRGAERTAWLRRMAEKRARTALASGGLEPVADRGANGHSVFANAFLAALRDNREVLDGHGLYQLIKRPVVLNAQQTPQYADVRNAMHEGGDFLFVPVTAAPPAAVTPPAADSSAVELAFWDSVKDSRNPAALEAYLARYPDGTFSVLARLRLEELQRPAPPVAAAPPPSAALAPPPAAVSAPPPARGPATWDGRWAGASPCGWGVSIELRAGQAKALFQRAQWGSHGIFSAAGSMDDGGTLRLDSGMGHRLAVAFAADMATGTLNDCPIELTRD